MIAVLIFSTSFVTAKTTAHKNSDSGLITWVSNSGDFSVELIQLIPDFIRAIYAKHNFPKQQVERIANFCVFGTVVKNLSGKALQYNVSNWRYINNGKSHKVKTKSQWLSEWQKAGITFSFTLLPDDVDFEAGDWQQGFTTIQLPRGEKFDLTYTWTIDGKRYNDTMQNIQCSLDGLPN